MIYGICLFLSFFKAFYFILEYNPLTGGSAGKKKKVHLQCENLVVIPGLGRSPGERNGYPFQYSGLENFMDCIVHGVAKSRTQLSDFHFHCSPLTMS